MKAKSKSGKKSWQEVNLPFVSGLNVVVRPVPVQFDSVSWVKELLARPVSVKEVQS